MLGLGAASGGESAVVDLIVARLDVNDNDLAVVLVFDLGADALLIQFLAAPDDLLTAKTWVRHIQTPSRACECPDRRSTTLFRHSQQNSSRIEGGNSWSSGELASCKVVEKRQFSSSL